MELFCVISYIRHEGSRSPVVAIFGSIDDAKNCISNLNNNESNYPDEEFYIQVVNVNVSID